MPDFANSRSISINLPEDFSFKLCLKFMDRNSRECLHRVDGDILYKAIQLNDEVVLFQVSAGDNQLIIHPLGAVLSQVQQQQVVTYFRELFDLDRDLRGFYQTFTDDPVIGPLIHQYRGLRLVRIPDLFEALCWSIIGQQINLNFAYSLKHRLVTELANPLSNDGFSYYTFPHPDAILNIPDKLFKSWQYSRAKTEYIKGISREMSEGRLDRGSLQSLPHKNIYERLLSLRGIGPWSANYVMMKTFGDTSAFPIQDAGLHQALRKRTINNGQNLLGELKTLENKWHPWQGYATFYLWYTLLDEAVTD